MRPFRFLLVVVALILPACGPVLIGAAAGSGGGGGGGTVAPTAPTGLSVTVLSSSSVELSWTDTADNEVGYLIELRETGSAADFTEQSRLAADVQMATADGLSPATGYDFRIVAVNSGGRGESAIEAVDLPPALSLIRVLPDSAVVGGVTPVEVHGRGFEALRPGSARELRFGGVLATDVTVQSDTLLVVVPPAGIPGTVALQLDNGFDSASLPQSFTLFASTPRFAPNDVRVNVSAAGIAGSSDPEICCSGQNVYCLWIDERAGANSDIFFNRSADGGASWATTETRLDTDGPGVALSEDPELTCEGDAVYAVWHDSRDGQSDIYFNRSLDNGVTWLAQDVRLDTDVVGAAASIDAEVRACGELVYVTWWDQRSGRFGVFLNRSLDRGTTWLSQDIRIDDAPAGDAGDPELFCEGDAVYVAWIDGRDGGLDVRFNRSLDRGATWLAQSRRLDTDAPGAANSANVDISVEGDQVFAVWEDVRNGFADIYCNRSSDGGETFGASDIRLNTDAAGTGSSFAARHCRAGDSLYVCWRDERTSGARVRFNRSLDGGSTWLASDVVVSSGTSTGLISGEPRIGCFGDNVYVSWADSRGAAVDVFMNWSTDAGASFGGTDLRIDTSPAGSVNAVAPQLCVDGARLYAMWRDSRDGAGVFGIYSNRRLP